MFYNKNNLKGPNQVDKNKKAQIKENSIRAWETQIQEKINVVKLTTPISLPHEGSGRAAESNLYNFSSCNSNYVWQKISCFCCCWGNALAMRLVQTSLCSYIYMQTAELNCYKPITNSSFSSKNECISLKQRDSSW